MSTSPSPYSASPSSAVPGMQVNGMSASTPRQSAIENMNSNATLLNNLNQIGGIFRKFKKMKGGQIIIPMPSPVYKETLAGNQSSSGQVVENANTMTASNENSKYDSLAASPAPIPANQLKGGYRKRNKSRKNSRKLKRKNKKTRKVKKSKKSKKSKK